MITVRGLSFGPRSPRYISIEEIVESQSDVGLLPPLDCTVALQIPGASGILIVAMTRNESGQITIGWQLDEPTKNA